VICPAFVSDCLETLEEIGMRGGETFLNAGGEDLRLIPCLNEHPAWIVTLARMVTHRWPEANKAASPFHIRLNRELVA
jgi:ferrochelatase